MDLFVLIAENTQIELKKLDEIISILIDISKTQSMRLLSCIYPVTSSFEVHRGYSILGR